ncbi:MAG: alpha-hydroxy-acid oxidizing protein [Micrococcales bacterium]|nr:alpha-hydroxy-acid oxidizing protein [Micrococcales bacterium]
MRPLELDPVARRLSRAYTVGDLRTVARARTPRSVFDYVDGAAEAEVSLRRARRVLRDVEFRPSVLRDVGDVDLSTTVLGRTAQAPFLYAPTGFTRMMQHEGERAVARSAARTGVPYTLSTMGTTSIEELADAAPDGRNWFGLYVWKDRGASTELMERARVAGYEALVITVDVPVGGARLRDNRNGFSIPPALSVKTVVDGALHPSWWLNFLTTEPLRFATLDSWQGTIEELASHMFDPTVELADLAWVREHWDGPLVVKGVQTVADAERVVGAGADAVVLSNHGGRQLDRAPVPLTLVPETVQALGDRAEVYVDTGFSNGADIVAAVALGARAVMLGRAYLYGLMAGGERGVDRVGTILITEIARTLRLLGVRSLAELTPDHVRLP